MRSTIPTLREGTGDDRVWRSVYLKNEYHLSDNLDGGVVIDVGANIGAFSCLAADRGCEKVIAIEASPSNYEILCSNVAKCRATIAVNKAIWIVDGEQIAICSESEMQLRAEKSGQRINYGGWHVGQHTNGDSLIDTIQLSTLLNEHRISRVDLLKVDCESSEWPLFVSILNDNTIDSISEIVGEYHLFGNVSYVPSNLLPLDWLREALQAKGFKVNTREHPTKPDLLGWFHCTRPGIKKHFIEKSFLSVH